MHRNVQVRFGERDGMATEIPRMNPPRAVPTLRIDFFTALAIKSRIGDIVRFPTKKHLCSYGAVVPGASNSGEYVSRHNRVKHGDMILKSALTCAVRGAVSAGKSSAVKRFYLKQLKKMGAQKAEVAAARKMACIVWKVLTIQQPYREEDKRLTARKRRIPLMEGEAARQRPKRYSSTCRGPCRRRHGPREVSSRLQRKVRGEAYLRRVNAPDSRIDFIRRFSRETNGKLERFYGILEAKWPNFHHDVDTIVRWHNDIKPHMSLNWKELETPIKAFQRKYPPWRRKPFHQKQW